MDWRVIADTLFRLPLTFWTGFLLASAGRQAFRLTKGRRKSSFSGANRAHLGNVGLIHPNISHMVDIAAEEDGHAAY